MESKAICGCGHPMAEHLEGFDFCAVDGCGCESFRDAGPDEEDGEWAEGFGQRVSRRQQ